MITAAFITHSAQPSGAELFVLRVCTAAKRVHPVVVLGEHGPLESMLSDRGIETIVMPLGRAAADVRSGGVGVFAALRGGIATVRTTMRLRRWLRRRNVDVVATHSAKAHVYGAFAARLARRPVVVHAHDLLGAGGGRATTGLLHAAYRWLPDVVIANSRTTLASLPAGARARATVIGCPAVIDSAAPHSGSMRRFAVVGRLARWKGQDVAVRAFAAARSAGLPAGSTLVIAGAALFDADRAYERELRVLVADLALEDAVEFAGHVDDVSAVYAASDAVLHTSRRPEPFGQVVVEAMAAGRPVIAADAGGPAEVVTDERDGLLTTPDVPEALAAAMLRLAGNPGLRAALIEGGRATVAQYSVDSIVEEVEAVLYRATGRS